MAVTDIISDIFSPIQQYAWYLALAALVIMGIFFTIKLKGLQILKINETAKLSFAGVTEGKTKRRVSSFEAFCIGMGARIGVGNIAGVATAIVTGGPGAIFWMWLFAIMGSATSFMESTLAQVYKEKKGDGQYYGGPAYYATKGLKSRKLGIFAAVMLILTFGIGFVGVQATNATAALTGAFEFEHNNLVFGAIIALVAGIIIFGGVKRVGRFSAKVVPVMALLWMIFAIIAICLNYEGVPNAIKMIFEYAFSAPALIGGGIGTAISVGMKRGIFSNEAGLGSVANIAASADTPHPAKQGMIQSFGVLVDTLIVCTITALVVLSYGNFEEIYGLGLKNAQLVQAIVSSTAIGDAANYIIALFMLVFAFTSMIGYYTMSESNVRFIKDNKLTINIVRAIVIVTILLASLVDTGLLDLISDSFNAIMGFTNILIVAALSPIAFAVYKDYRKQKDAGVEDPEFHRECLAGMKYADGITEWGPEMYAASNSDIIPEEERKH